MKTRAALLLFALALLPGCGDRRLVLNIDVLSYIDPLDRTDSFGPIPAVPPSGAYIGETPLVNDQQVSLLEGLNGVSEVQAVDISINLFTQSITGTGVDTLRLYLSDVNTPPQNTVPVIQQAFSFTPGRTDSIQITSAGDQRIADLFTAKKMRVSLTTALRGPGVGPALTGKVELHALRCVVITKRKPA